MFQVQPNPTFQIEVTVPTPTGAGKLTLTFKHKGRKALKDFLAALQQDVSEDQQDDTKLLLDIVDGWDGVDAKFSPKAFGDLLDNYPSAARAIMDAYVNTLLEGTEKAKN